MYKINNSNVTVMVSDMNKSVDFYTKGLGLDLKQRWEDYYAMVAAPGVIIGLHPAQKVNERPNDISIGFSIDNLTQVEDRLKELRIKYERAEDGGGYYFNFKDPDGTPLYFMQLKEGNW